MLSLKQSSFYSTCYILVALVQDKKGNYLFALASLVLKAGKVVQISGKARNLNHPSRFLRAKRAKN
jgi:hypothetical protein